MRFFEVPRQVIYVIEALQENGQWMPVGCPAEGQFTKAAAERRLREMKQRYPHMKHGYFQQRIRIEPYIPVRLAGKMQEVFLDDSGAESDETP